MGTRLTYFLLTITVSLILTSCSILQNGYFNDMGQYVPKRPRFELIDKEGMAYGEIDTIHFYKRTLQTLEGSQVYPTVSRVDRGFDMELNSVDMYLGFLTSGLCVAFSVPRNFSLTERSLDSIFQMGNYLRSYYYSSDGVQFEIESFVYGAGNGHYVMTKMNIVDEKGEFLEVRDGLSRIIYNKTGIEIPHTLPLILQEY